METTIQCMDCQEVSTIVGFERACPCCLAGQSSVVVIYVEDSSGDDEMMCPTDFIAGD